MKNTFLLLTLLSFIFQNLMAQDISNIGSGGKLKPLQQNMDIRHYTLVLDVNIEKEEISGYTEIELDLLKQADTLLFDLISVYKISHVLIDKKPQKFTHKDHQIFITTDKQLTTGKHLVKIFYEGNPPIAALPPWEGGFTWAKDKNDNPLVSINCQWQGAKLFFPCKDHPSDEADKGADLYITVPNGLTVAGPGLLQNTKKNKEGKSTWHWKTNYTISNYCIVFNIGKYKVKQRSYTTVENNKVPIQFYVLEQDTANADKVLSVIEKNTAILEKYFGEYPWAKEKIGFAQVPNSGMEHQTMVTYSGSFKFVSFPNGTYSDELFHEFGHEWFANKVTNKDWAHMWIQEGITTYAEALAMRELGGETAYDSIMIRQRGNIQNQKPIVADDGMRISFKDINRDIYPKGSYLMHTLRYVLDDSVFFPALKSLSTNVKYPYKEFLVTDDVEQHFSNAAGKSLKPLFDFYLKTTNTIDIDIYKTKPDTYMMHVNNSPMELPVDIVTDAGTIRTTLSTDEENYYEIKSRTQPIIDPRNWYFKKVTYQ